MKYELIFAMETDDNLRYLLNMIEQFIKQESNKNDTVVRTCKIGISKYEDLYDKNYDLDELNAEIEKLFS